MTKPLNYKWKLLGLSLLWLLIPDLNAQTVPIADAEELRRIRQIQQIPIAPNFLGPNALPVPEIGKGKVSSRSRLEAGWTGSFSEGDDTQSFITNLNYVVLADRIAIHVQFVPVEFFNLTRDEQTRRNIEDEFFESSGTQTGDVYYGFEVQILKEKKGWPDLMVRGSVKTASGENVENGRFTDSPGYFFDASLGKDIKLDENRTIRPYGQLGFYSWQTYDVVLPQNDATMFGVGVDYDSEKYMFSSSLVGYAGWKDNGDDPVLWRIEGIKKLGKYDLKLGYQHGINDWQFRSITASLILNFDAAFNISS
ncbi:MAG: hypothetical protein AAF363_01910 [Bacteroidota bacterium]